MSLGSIGVNSPEELFSKIRRQKKTITALVMVSILTTGYIANTLYYNYENGIKKDAIVAQANSQAEGIILEANQEAAMIKAQAQIDASQLVQQMVEEQSVETESTLSRSSVDKEINPTDIKDYDLLLKITEAEAGDQSLECLTATAAVILNRVKSDKFPNTIKEVVYEKGQFTPVSNGRLNRVKVTEETKKAVNLALNGSDPSNGALYFYDNKYISSRAKSGFNHYTITAKISSTVFLR